MIDFPTSIPAQPPARSDVVTVVEKWESIEALEAHLMAPHMLDYRKTVKDLVVDTTLLVLEPA
jgi:quinol monooxygenase YgiN